MTKTFDGVSELDFLGVLSPNVRTSVLSLEKAGADWQTLGDLLSNTPSMGVALKGVNWNHSLWQAVRVEFHSFLCTETEAYKDLREQWKTLVKGGPGVMVASIAGAIGAQLGMASGVLVPIVVWLCVVVARLGKNALCSILLPASPITPNNMGAPTG